MILAIGDVHIKQNNLTLIDVLNQQLRKICQKYKPDTIILLGDILHDHSRVFTPCLNKALLLIETLREFCQVIIIVGNHDMCSGALYLTQDHWLNPLKEWRNVLVVDYPIRIKDNLFCPYVPPGRLIEALSNINWKDAKYLFCHQEFKGCNMGMVVSQDGDEWDGLIRVISGHIHGSQSLSNNIYYVGSSTPTSFSETKERHVLLIDESEEKEIPLNLPKKVTLTKKIDELDEVNTSLFTDLRIRIQGTESEYKTFKKSKKYKNFIENGVKIVFIPPKTEIATDYKNLTFRQIFLNEINKLNVNENVQIHIRNYIKHMNL